MLVCPFCLLLDNFLDNYFPYNYCTIYLLIYLFNIPVPGDPALWFVLSEVLLASLKHILVPIIMIMIIVMIMVEIS